MASSSIVKKIFFLPYGIYQWVFFMPFLSVLTAIFGFLAVVLVFTVSPRTASRVAGVTWARLIGFFTPIFVKVEGRENIDPKQSYVIISNHKSQYDIPLLYGWIGVDFKWVMKQELRKIPMLGIACERIGHIFIDRSNKTKALESIDTAKKIIRDGTSVVFFPEGTRSEGGELGKFKMGAFRMALDLDLPILPVAISGTGNILPPTSVFTFPGKVRMSILEPVQTDGYKMSNVRELMNKSRDAIVEGLAD